jgi:leucyl-tRNA synthetase
VERVMAKYDFKDVESKWQKKWEESGIYRAKFTEDRKKFYVLEMFPYTSAQIHMGHVRNYTIGDVVSRFLTLKGFNTLHPIGYDAFGMPAENAAIKQKTHPKEWTYKNISTISRQLKQLGISYCWERELATCDPEYYRWNQYFFLKLYKEGLIYKKLSPANWCPSCRTVLANEQVIDGRCWRCGTPVEQKELSQWFIKITAYAEKLLDFSGIRKWPERVITMQKNWIGKSYGCEVQFKISALDKDLKVFTTRPDTLFGATYVVISPRHPFVQDILSKSPSKEEILNFLKRFRNQNVTVESTVKMEKEGVYTGLNAVNPVNNEEIPVWLGNYVLMEYGTGAIMAVPAHDQRDFEFANRYHLPVKTVIKAPEWEKIPDRLEQSYEGEGIMVNSGIFDGMDNTRGIESITEYLEKNGKGKKTTNYSLRDWCISRQRYWGTPIPIIYCKKCGIVPVPEKDLPVKLPDNVEITGMGESPLKNTPEFLHCKCPVCGGEAVRETDTMDTFMDSSWYFLRYASGDNRERPFSKEEVNYWMPVDQYIGGIEHAILHLLYSRFFVKVLNDMGYLNFKEPFENLLCQGMVIKDGFKMSKSKGNVVDPEYVIKKYGVDTLRLFILFAAPPELDLEWSEKGIEGTWRFINRIWILNSNISGYKDTGKNVGDITAEKLINRMIKGVTEDIEKDFHFNTAIAKMMEFTSDIHKIIEKRECSKAKLMDVWHRFIKIMAPFIPHISEELWEMTGNKKSVFSESWPEIKKEYLVEKEASVAVQIDGKVRGRITVVAGSPESEVLERVINDPGISKWLKDKKINKQIYVQDRILNLVTK